jgi:hypothetical protein
MVLHFLERVNASPCPKEKTPCQPHKITHRHRTGANLVADGTTFMSGACKRAVYINGRFGGVDRFKDETALAHQGRNGLWLASSLV